MTVIIVAISILLFVSIEAIGVLLRRRRVETATEKIRAFAPVHAPKGVFLSPGHSWAFLTQTGELRLGVDELLAQALGGADRVELPKPGTTLRKGEPMAKIHRLSRTLTVPSPVDGTVVAVNETVARGPVPLDADPYGAFWFVTAVPMEHTEALASLKVGDRAVQWLKGEMQRFSEFLAARLTPKALGVALADGARPVVGAALALDEAAFSQFQREFAGVNPS
ncbi:hypothetical protein EG19_12420 [Thermoanaerobaculum aquaticum]|uniref:Glycine cleavage system protein H n=1 Tax=Thermoanaerobaculum aquaticum TaxID=1312852 RepID=A0A062XTV6_9BACT|nr:glycine cleavage system protein H [Thermoanaerobaculum aquaticum]KDA54278.1 hypothetical protein EG19_12420 [Thermoanaerobaculum aquaticum]